MTNRFNSTIRQKKCKADCGRYPKIGYKGFCSEKCMNEAGVSADEKDGKVKKASKLSKKERVWIADTLFKRWVFKRDSDSMKNIFCVCCKKKYNLQEKTESGESIVQPLHFVSRSVISLRWDENNVNAGCCYCNLDMHTNPLGDAYQAYKAFLIGKVGAEKVDKMEIQKRVVEKMTESLADEIIAKYKK